MRSIVSAILILSTSLACSEEEAATKVTVHLCGEARKPGKYEIPPACSYEDLEKATGGWTEWGSGKRFFVLRFPRMEGLFMQNGLQQRKQEVLQSGQLEKKDGRFVFLPGDVIYIPMKSVAAR